MEHRCLFIIKGKQGSNRCNLLFKSANQLLEHRQKAKHILKRKKKSGETTSSGKKKKQIRLEQVMDVGTTGVFEEEKVDDKNSEVPSETSATCDEDSTMQNVLGGGGGGGDLLRGGGETSEIFQINLKLMFFRNSFFYI